MCNIAHVIGTKNNNFLLKNNNHLLKKLYIYDEMHKFQDKFAILNFLTIIQKNILKLVHAIHTHAHTPARTHSRL